MIRYQHCSMVFYPVFVLLFFFSARRPRLEALHGCSPIKRSNALRPAEPKTSHAPARARLQPHSLVAGASHTRLSLAHRSEPVEHLWSAPWLAGSGFDSCCLLGSVAPDQLLSGPGRRSLAFLWLPVTGVSGAEAALRIYPLRRSRGTVALCAARGRGKTLSPTLHWHFWSETGVQKGQELASNNTPNRLINSFSTWPFKGIVFLLL